MNPAGQVVVTTTDPATTAGDAVVASGLLFGLSFVQGLIYGAIGAGIVYLVKGPLHGAAAAPARRTSTARRASRSR